jgi:hypothetical protein
MKMPFGKHRGQAVSTLPRQYLRWLADNVELKGQLKGEVQAALYGVPVSPKVQAAPINDVETVVVDIETQLAELEKKRTAGEHPAVPSSFTQREENPA